jgi:hypothetical protein
MTPMMAGRGHLPGENGMNWNDRTCGATVGALCGLCGSRVGAPLCRCATRLERAA